MSQKDEFWRRTFEPAASVKHNTVPCNERTQPRHSFASSYSTCLTNILSTDDTYLRQKDCAHSSLLAIFTYCKQSIHNIHIYIYIYVISPYNITIMSNQGKKMLTANIPPPYTNTHQHVHTHTKVSPSTPFRNQRPKENIGRKISVYSSSISLGVSFWRSQKTLET